jgi:hypothetical protein
MKLHGKTKIRTGETESRIVTLYDLVDAVNLSVKPGEEDMVPLIVSHLLSSCKATLGNG